MKSRVDDYKSRRALRLAERAARRNNRFDAGEQDVDWITVNGAHIPIDSDGTAVGGALKGEKFSRAKPSTGTTQSPTRVKVSAKGPKLSDSDATSKLLWGSTSRQETASTLKDLPDGTRIELSDSNGSGVYYKYKGKVYLDRENSDPTHTGSGDAESLDSFAGKIAGGDWDGQVSQPTKSTANSTTATVDQLRVRAAHDPKKLSRLTASQFNDRKETALKTINAWKSGSSKMTQANLEKTLLSLPDKTTFDLGDDVGQLTKQTAPDGGVYFTQGKTKFNLTSHYSGSDSVASEFRVALEAGEDISIFWDK